MADPAFDVFSQRRDTGTKDRVTERRRVDTYTDPNRYQMPPRRRLGVQAQNKDMTVTPEKTNITAFAEGLAKIQPSIMDYLTSQKAAENQQQIQYGIQEAMGVAAEEAGDTEFIDNQWKQFGYEQQKAYLLGEALANDLAVQAENRDLTEPYENWYARWWEETNAKYPNIATMNPEHMDSFNKPLIKGVTQAKNKDLVLQEERIDAEQKATASQIIYEEYLDLYNEGNITEEAWLAMKKDLTYLNRLTHKEQTDIKVDTLIKIATDPNILDKSALDVLMKPGWGVQKDANGVDQVISMPNSLYHDPAYHEKIKGAMEEIARAKATKKAALEAEEKQRKAKFKEHQTTGHKKVSEFIGYDPAIAFSMDPESAQVARALEVIGKEKFTEYYIDLIPNLGHEKAMEKAVELVKEEMYAYESPGRFKARQEYSRWWKDTNYKIKKDISSSIGKAKLAEVLEKDGKIGFTKLYGNIDQFTIDQLAVIAKGEQATNKIKTRKNQNNIDIKLEDKVEAAEEKISNYENNINTRWEDKSNEFNEAYNSIREQNDPQKLTDKQIYDFMLQDERFKDL